MNKRHLQYTMGTANRTSTSWPEKTSKECSTQFNSYYDTLVSHSFSMLEVLYMDFSSFTAWQTPEMDQAETHDYSHWASELCRVWNSCLPDPRATLNPNWICLSTIFRTTHCISTEPSLVWDLCILLSKVWLIQHLSMYNKEEFCYHNRNIQTAWCCLHNPTAVLSTQVVENSHTLYTSHHKFSPLWLKC